MKICIILFICVPVLAAPADEQPRYFTSDIMPAKGVVLLAHGLNVRPSKMGDEKTDGTLAKLFLDAGYHVYRVTLRGHGGDAAEMQKVTAQDWLADALSQYRAAANHAENAALPLFLAAFSLGALVYENVIHTQNDVTFAAAVFFAPALAVKPAARALLFADVFLDDTAIITSRAPPEYRAQKGASLGAYKALFELEDALAQCGGAVAGGGIPTLVFIDPEDEFVSLPALRKQAAGASNWKIVTVSNAGAKVKPPRHHLIIDADCVSALTWNTMCETTLRFLEGLKP